MRNISLALLFIISLTLFGCGNSGPDTSQAKAYQVIKASKATPARPRVTCSIFAPEAKSKEEFAHTVMQAAQSIQAETGAKVVVIELEEDPRTVGKGVLLGMAFYAPDGGGFSGDQGWTWDVKAADKRHTEDVLRMTTLWFRNRDRFQVPDGYGSTMTDEAALSAFIGKTMEIAPESVTLAFWTAPQYFKE